MRLRVLGSLLVAVLVMASGCAGLAADETTLEPTSSATESATGEATSSRLLTTSPPDPVCESPPDPSRKSLPERPTELTAENATGFAVAYEEAVVWNAMAEDSWNLSVHVSNATVVVATGDGYLLHLRGSTHHRTCLDGSVVAGTGVIRTNYFVNETAVFRLATLEDRTADPRRGGARVDA